MKARVAIVELARFHVGDIAAAERSLKVDSAFFGPCAPGVLNLSTGLDPDGIRSARPNQSDRSA